MKNHQMGSTAPYAVGNTASQQAAKSIEPRLTGVRKQVYDHIVRSQDLGATGSEMSHTLDLLPYTVKPRCTELRDAGLIIDSGRMRQNKQGSNETVWIKAPEGHVAPEKQLTDKQIIKEQKDRIEKLEKTLSFISKLENFAIERNPSQVRDVARNALKKV